MASQGPNPLLLVRDHLPEYIAELEAKLDKAVAQVQTVQLELATARTLLAVAPKVEDK